MAEASFAFVPGRFGRAAARPGLRVREVIDVACASVIARRGQHGAAALAAERHLGCPLPDRPRHVAGPDVAFLWTGPGQWLAVSTSSPVDIESRLAAALTGVASVVDQSDSRVMLELDGTRVRDVLARGCSIDLDPRAFRVGDVAATAVAHLNVLLWQVDDAPRYRILVVRTWFESFWRWLAASAAPFGGEVLDPRPFLPSSTSLLPPG